MLRVPFILRLPDGKRPADLDTSGLVTLEDVVPTRLGLVGVEPDVEVGGSDLLSPTRPAERGFLARSAANLPHYAFRTSVWKLVVRNDLRAGWQLFDLEDDPGEQRNRVLNELDRAVELSTCLAGQLVPASSPPAASPARIDEESLEALRALGYAE